jgi:DNA mismatch endonuclease (patch repair protein)
MRAVKSRDTAPEIALRKALFARGFRYRIDDRSLPGSPDLVFPQYSAVLFVHGCFWHGHDCARGARTPKTNADYWRAKVNRNRERDKAVIDALQRDGWHVFVSWECQIKHVSAAASEAALWLASLKQGGAAMRKGVSQWSRTSQSRTLKKAGAAAIGPKPKPAKLN